METVKKCNPKRKAHFKRAYLKKRKEDDLTGSKGFICTCNGNEKGCIREAMNILHHYESKINHKTTIRDDCSNDEDEDIEKALKEEVKAAKDTVKKFTVKETGIDNCICILSTVDNVLEIGEAIVKDIERTKVAKSRFLIRLIPFEITCKVYNEDIKKAADKIFDAHFKGEPTTYCIHVTKRNNNNLLKTEITNDLARLVRDRNINHVVNLKTPAKTVNVEIIRNICCISVINNFFGYRKYNLIELASNKSTGGQKVNQDTLKASSDEKGLEVSQSSKDPDATSSEHDMKFKEALDEKPSEAPDSTSNEDTDSKSTEALDSKSSEAPDSKTKETPVNGESPSSTVECNENDGNIDQKSLSSNSRLDDKSNEDPPKCEINPDTIDASENNNKNDVL